MLIITLDSRLSIGGAAVGRNLEYCWMLDTVNGCMMHDPSDRCSSPRTRHLDTGRDDAIILCCATSFIIVLCTC